MMSREFSLEATLKIWDFIFGGIDSTMVSAFIVDKAQEDCIDFDSLLKAPRDDPFINLECLSIAMIALLKEDLLEADFSMCLGLLMSYKEPQDFTSVLTKSCKVRDSLLNGAKYERSPSPENSDNQAHDHDSEEAKGP